MRLGSRGSALAMTQAEHVARLLGEGVEVVAIATSGDGTGASAAGDKTRWVDALEAALAAGEIDLAVHSAKDVPGELSDGLELLGAPARADARDALCGAASVEQLPRGARIGTSSLRRLAQLRAAREDIEVTALRGNVDTRLRRLAARHEGLDAIVLARAGLERLGRDDAVTGVLDERRFVPAPGQGTLVLEGRAEDESARSAAGSISDRAAFDCLLAERSLARDLGASCHTPLGAHAVPVAGALVIRSWVGLPDGSAWIADELDGPREEPESLGALAAARLRAVGAEDLLRRAEELAGRAGA
ncbi:MAG TPA: hydroxymethylbilane synthase [Solirubrobacteraceae bacterium]|jgi:hydroxymethylbilane synthase|nr:hydroxymethylbilane synthase [Solirubrobacteraceae bacterium]